MPAKCLPCLEDSISLWRDNTTWNKKQEKSSLFWDKRSKVFDQQVLAVYENAYKKTIKRSIPFLNQGDTMLEIGCGTGIATITLADYVRK